MSFHRRYSLIDVRGKQSIRNEFSKSMNELLFVGEHTKTNYPSIFYGAYSSGVDISKRVVE